jgi:hypothetical protein
VRHKAYELTSVVSFAHLKEDKNVYKYPQKDQSVTGLKKKQHESKRRS